MGNLLGAPITEKMTDVGKTIDGLSYGTSSMQGWRVHMEDSHICEAELYAEFEEELKNASVPDNIIDQKDSAEANTLKRIRIKNTSLFAVFDGHGGAYAAKYSSNNFVKIFSRQPKLVKYAQLLEESEDLFQNGSYNNHGEDKGSMFSSLEKKELDEEVVLRERELLDLMESALTDAFLDLDKKLYSTTVEDQKMDDEGNGCADNEDVNLNSGNAEEDTEEENPLNDESGTTVVVVVLTPRWIICANAGDSRAIYSKQNGRAIPLSYDHKPDDEEEERRISEAGGYVSGGRVDGDLAVSRGFGDFRFKGSANLGPTEQRVSPLPDIIVQNRSKEEDEFLVLACDGIWDVNSNKECVDMIKEIFAEGENNLGLACEEVLDMSLRKGSKDNMTCSIIQLPALKYGTGEGVMGRRAKLEAEQQALREEAKRNELQQQRQRTLQQQSIESTE